MLNLKFVILRSLSKLCMSLAAKISRAKKKQAEKCRDKQKQVFLKALTLESEAVKQVQQDEIKLEQARAEAIARVNREYDKKIASLDVSIEAAHENANKEHDKVLAYLKECGACFK